jgi:hypothetical protein
MISETVGQLHYVSTKPKDDGKVENNYVPKYVARLLMEKDPYGIVLFYFRNRKDYVALFPSGHLNVRGGEDDLFRSWGSSEFKDLKPQIIFRELEKEIEKINFITTLSRNNYYFNSYNEFISWLAGESEKK